MKAMTKSYQEKLKGDLKKIVISTSVGGFGLSDEAFEMYLKLKGIRYYKEDHEDDYTSYYRVPKEKYHEFDDKWCKEGDYLRINTTKWLLYDRDIDRDDPILIQVVEKLKDRANSTCSELKIVKIPKDVDWYIDDNDGPETVEEKHRTWS